MDNISDVIYSFYWFHAELGEPEVVLQIWIEKTTSFYSKFLRKWLNYPWLPLNCLVMTNFMWIVILISDRHTDKLYIFLIVIFSGVKILYYSSRFLDPIFRSFDWLKPSYLPYFWSDLDKLCHFFHTQIEPDPIKAFSIANNEV